MKYSVMTFGCRVNQADSLAFEEELQAAGSTCAAPCEADLVIVNTCSVTATADQGARQAIRRVARDNPHARIVVTGCYATRRPDELAALPGVARVVRNDDKPRLLPLLRAAGTFADGDGPCGAPIEPGIAGRTAFTLRVQTGCAENCSYCIIPTTRGAPRSVPIETVLGEIDRVRRAGFKEIALTGVHLGSYGRDSDPPTSLVALLRAIDARCQASGADLLFRISSLEPMDCPADLVALAAASGRFAPHFHLPLQHASGRMLSAMRRPYTIERYSSLVDAIRVRMPHAAIGSDVIAGFPGETDRDFDALADYLEASPLTHLHVFPYSDRPGTPASAMHAKVQGATIRERGRRLREIGKNLSERFHESQVGTSHRALTLEDGSSVVTGNYLKLKVPPGRARNEWVRVRVASHDHGELLGG